MTDEERDLARLEADLHETETLIKQWSLLRRPLAVEVVMLRWLKQRSADISSQIEEMQRHTDLEEPPTSPAAYRRWVNRSQKLGD